MPPIPRNLKTGVYCWLNTVNGKVYVGSAAKGFAKRKNGHITDLNRGVHCNRYLQRAWGKHSKDAFRFVVLDRCPPGRCVAYEQRWIDELQAANPAKGYNLSPTAGSPLGAKHTPEARAANSARFMGRKPPPGHIERLAELHRGVPLTDEHRANISKGQKGRAVSEKQKVKLREAWVRRKAKFGPTGHANIEEVANKRWATRRANGKENRGERHPLHKLTAEDVLEARRLTAVGVSQAAIAARLNVNQSCISRAVNGKRWSWLVG